jgi:2Fe-2S ferredoxin
MEEISLFVVDSEGTERELKIPIGIAMSLMEALRAFDEPLEATCGGMALCASCHIQVLEGSVDIGELTSDEEAMLETLPEYTDACRLSCQVQVSEQLHGIRIRYMQPLLY